jgi:hypothetical protein
VPAENVIRIMCPNLACRRVLAVPVVARGKIVRCGRCGMNIRIPSATGDDEQESPATPSEGT